MSTKLTTKELQIHKGKQYYKKYGPFLCLQNDFRLYKLYKDGYIRGKKRLGRSFTDKFYSYPKENIVNLEYGIWYTGVEIYKRINGRKMLENLEPKHIYKTAPRKYRKSENKKFKELGNIELRLEGVEASPEKYKRNGSWYY